MQKCTKLSPFSLICGILISVAFVFLYLGNQYKQYELSTQPSEQPSMPVLLERSECPCNRETAQVEDSNKNITKPSGIVLYNRVPKCGSRTVGTVLGSMATKHNFTYYFSLEFTHFHLSSDEEKQLAGKIMDLKRPLLYDRHVHWMDFEKHGWKKPFYINMIRDPLEQRISGYYYKRSDRAEMVKSRMDQTRFNQTYDECVKQGRRECLPKQSPQVAFFCGNHPVCRSRNHQEALKLAKRHLEDEYLVVGLTEDMESFFFLLETLLPEFFHGASTVYQALKIQLLEETKTKAKGEISEETRNIVMNHLHYDYDFYNYARQVFYNKISEVAKAKHVREFSPVYIKL